jgi:hypothetical protein
LHQILQFNYPYASIKDVQVAKEAFSSLKRTYSTSKHEISYFFYFCGPFLPSWIWIRIPNMDSDPDPMTRFNPDPIRIGIRNPDSKTYQLPPLSSRLLPGQDIGFRLIAPKVQNVLPLLGKFLPIFKTKYAKIS